MSEGILQPDRTLRSFELPGAVRIDAVEPVSEHKVRIRGRSSEEGPGTWEVRANPEKGNVIPPYAWRSYEFEVAMQAVADQEAEHGLEARDVRFNDVGAHLETRVPNTDEHWRFWLVPHAAETDHIEFGEREREAIASSDLHAACLVAVTDEGDASAVRYLPPSTINDLAAAQVSLDDADAATFEPRPWVARIADEYDLPADLQHWLNLPFAICSACALRFRGHRYREEHGFVDDDILDTYLRTGRLTGAPLARWTAFFILQRGLGGRGLERTPPNGDNYHLFYHLFLDLYDTDIPDEYVREQRDETWRREYAPKLDDCVAFVRRVHRAMPYDFDAPPRT